MQSFALRLSLFIIAPLITLASLAPAQEAVTAPQEPIIAVAADVNEANVPSFPYFARITADDVYVRSGPGTNYYPCGKLNKDDKVKIVGRKHSWSHIVPPTSSFSWISAQYVKIDADNPGRGIVTGEAVRVYAGSDFIEPMHSEQPQLKLNTNDTVVLLGEEKDGYYKITPPNGAYLWVSTEYTEPMQAGPAVSKPSVLTSEPNDLNHPTAVVPTPLSTEAKRLNEYRAIQGKINAEKQKPFAQQDYSSLKQALLEIANDKNAGKAARYSQYMIEQIKRCELAMQADKQLSLQDQQLQQTRQRIEKARDKKIEEFEHKDLAKFAVMGQFQTSNVYGAEPQLRHYRILNDSGNIICYALPAGQAAGADLSTFLGKKVGLVGTIEPYPQIKGALVRFTQIELLK